MEQEKNEKMTVQKLAQSVPLADVLDIAEDVAKYVPAAGGVIKIVIKILRLLLTIKKWYESIARRFLRLAFFWIYFADWDIFITFAIIIKARIIISIIFTFTPFVFEKSCIFALRNLRNGIYVMT